MSANPQRIEQGTAADFDIGQGAGVQGSAIAARFSGFTVRPESFMPWDSGLAEDGWFKKALFHGLGILVALIVIVSLLPTHTNDTVKKVEREQYARLVIETKKVPPPRPEVKKTEVKKPDVKKPKPKPVEPKKPQVKKAKPKKNDKPVVKPKKLEPPKPTQAELRKKAREKASNAGLMAFADDLSSLRQKSNHSVSSLSAGGGQAKQVKRQLIAAKSTGKISGGAAISQQSSAAGLAGAGQADVVVSQAVVDAVDAELASERSSNRSAEDIRRVMDANKGAIYSVYNRALRKNPALEGTFTFNMVIDASGAITSVSLVSSELNDPALEKRLLSRIRMIRFDAAEVGDTQVNYSFDFLPY